MEYDAKTIWSFILVLTAALAYRYIPRWRAKSPFVEPGTVKQRLWTPAKTWSSSTSGRAANLPEEGGTSPGRSTCR